MDIYIDKIMDSISVLILALGLGLSGYAKIEIALIFACMYFILLMFHVDLVTHVQNITQKLFWFGWSNRNSYNWYWNCNIYVFCKYILFLMFWDI